MKRTKERAKRIDLDEARDRIMDQIYYCLKEPACVLHLWNYVLGDGAWLVRKGKEDYLEYFPSSLADGWVD